MRVSDRCYAVTGLGYSTPWCVNAGFVAGDDLTLVVDTGANRLAAQTIHGYARAAKPGNQLRVINTEKHFRSHRREWILSRAGDRRVGSRGNCANASRIPGGDYRIQRRDLQPGSSGAR